MVQAVKVLSAVAFDAAHFDEHYREHCEPMYEAFPDACVGVKRVYLPFWKGRARLELKVGGTLERVGEKRGRDVEGKEEERAKEERDFSSV